MRTKIGSVRLFPLITPPLGNDYPSRTTGRVIKQGERADSNSRGSYVSAYGRRTRPQANVRMSEDAMTLPLSAPETRHGFRARYEHAAAATLRRQSYVAWVQIRTLYNF